jgi:hypothetical protein
MSGEERLRRSSTGAYINYQPTASRKASITLANVAFAGVARPDMYRRPRPGDETRASGPGRRRLSAFPPCPTARPFTLLR